MSDFKPNAKLKGEDKFKRLPTKIKPIQVEERQRIPSWIRIRAVMDSSVTQLKQLLREHQLTTVCEEASCPI